MQELIKVQEEGGQQRVSARELWKGLESKQQFADWIKAKVLDNPFFTENEDYFLLHKFVEQKNTDEVFHKSMKNPKGGRPRKDYALTIDTAKKVAMAEQTPRGEVIRKYFIECEKKLKEIALPSYQIEDRIERAQTWITEERERIALENKNAVLTRKVDNLSTALDNLMDYASIIAVAKHNGVHEKTFSYHKLKKMSELAGREIKKTPCPRYGTKNLYHVDVWKMCYDGYDYDLKDVYEDEEEPTMSEADRTKALELV